MEWNGMETDMAHTDWSQLWSTGRSDRVASLSLSLGDDDGDDVILPSYPHRHTRTFVPCLHTSSAACYTGLRRLAVVMTTVVDGTVCDDRLTIGGRSTWIPHASHGHVDTADVTRRTHQPPQRRLNSGYVHLRRPARPLHVTESDRREHGKIGRAHV